MRLSYKENTANSQETIFTDGFESMSNWDRSENSFGWALTALDTSKKKTGNSSGRIDDNYPSNWEKYVFSDTWTPIENTEATYYTVSGWVYVEAISNNDAQIWLMTRRAGENGYPTGAFNTLSTKRGSWEYLEKTVLVPADVRALNVRIDNNKDGTVWFDDIKIVKGNAARTIVVAESNYYPFGLKHKGYNNVVSSNGNSIAQKFGYNGVELEESLGYDMNEMDWRHYDPAIGRFNVIDPMSEERNWLTPYNFVQNNPILRVDPTGLLDDYGYDTETGNITLVRKTDDATDKLVDSKTNETISSDVEKGVLKDGQNIKKNGLQTSQVSAGGKLAIDISMHTNEEVVSVVYQNDSGDRFLEVISFENNSVTRNEEGKVTAMNAGTSQEIKSSFTSSDGSFTGKPIYSIHTHPGHPDGLDYIGSPDPSNSDVRIAIQNKAVNGVDVPYYIIGSKTSNKWGKASNRTRYGANGKVKTVQPHKKKKN